VLDVFAGSGAFGIIAALHGAQAVTVDTYDRAVACAVRNAELNQVAYRVDVRHGTMRDCLEPDEKFDLIIANPPLLPGEPSDGLSGAMLTSGVQATYDFIRPLQWRLASDGRCYLATSSAIITEGGMLAMCAPGHLVPKRVASLDADHETYIIYRITHRSDVEF
jgi:release factor glutamine methyltransferase